MKSPMNQRPDDAAREDTEKFIAKYTRKPGSTAKGAKPASKKKAAPES
jgi:hypothetical protein